MTVKPRWKLIGVSTDGWYQFTNLRSSDDVRREGYMIHRDNFWQIKNRCWDCGMPNGRHGKGCDQMLACWEKQLLMPGAPRFTCALPTGHEGDCRSMPDCLVCLDTGYSNPGDGWLCPICQGDGVISADEAEQ